MFAFDMNNFLTTILACLATYLIAKKGSDETARELQDMRAQLNNVNDQLVYTTDQVEQKLKKTDTAASVQATGFIGIVSGFTPSDVLISYRWW